mgnify:CR=1 FL=1
MTVNLGMPTPPIPTLAPRRKTRQLMVGGVGVGSDYPITVQSMTTTKTHDINATLQQIAVALGLTPQEQTEFMHAWATERLITFEELLDPGLSELEQIDAHLDTVLQENAQALVTAEVVKTGDEISVKFRLFDVFAGQPQGDGMQFDARAADWRRAAHKAADQVYSRLTGEAPYFDSRVVFVNETGPKDARLKRIGIMDYDGANPIWVTEARSSIWRQRATRNQWHRSWNR